MPGVRAGRRGAVEVPTLDLYFTCGLRLDPSLTSTRLGRSGTGLRPALALVLWRSALGCTHDR